MNNIINSSLFNALNSLKNLIKNKYKRIFLCIYTFFNLIFLIDLLLFLNIIYIYILVLKEQLGVGLGIVQQWHHVGVGY